MGMASPVYRPENADGIISSNGPAAAGPIRHRDQIDGRNTRFMVPPADISDPFEGELPTQVQSAPAFQGYPVVWFTSRAAARPLPPA
jgi:hypothetical protein